MAGLFVSVFNMAIDTIFLSFCEDCERNDGSANKPFFMSDSLKAFVTKHSTANPDLAKGGEAAEK